MSLKVIGITGGIGSGKSTFCKFLSQEGAPVFECDSQARRLYVEDEDFARWVSREILGEEPSGEIDLRKVSAAVFHDKSLLGALEKQVFCRLEVRLRCWLEEVEKTSDVAFIESAIFDKATQIRDLCDEIIEIYSEEAIDRAALRDGLERDSILARAAMQTRLEGVKVIYNNGTLEELRANAQELLKQYGR